MRRYCTLYLNFNQIKFIDEAIKSDFISQGSLTDNESQAELVRKAKFNAMGMNVHSMHRFYWSVSTNDIVFSDDVIDHISWLLGCVNEGVHLFYFRGDDFEFGLSLFWGGNGTGGGPLISNDVAQILLEEKIDLGIGFYLED